MRLVRLAEAWNSEYPSQRDEPQADNEDDDGESLLVLLKGDPINVVTSLGKATPNLGPPFRERLAVFVQHDTLKICLGAYASNPRPIRSKRRIPSLPS
jgi:hypothetical protein